MGLDGKWIKEQNNKLDKLYDKIPEEFKLIVQEIVELEIELEKECGE